MKLMHQRKRFSVFTWNDLIVQFNEQVYKVQGKVVTKYVLRMPYQKSNPEK